MTGPEGNAVRHDPKKRRYELVADGHLGFAEYEFDGNRQVFTRTYVPPEVRGRGMAEKLVETALTDAKAAGRKIVPSCSYVAKFIGRNPKFRELLG